MATDKTFTVAGTSKHNGGFKVRFANDLMRTKNLTKSGHTDIILIELPRAMSKIDAVNFIATQSEFDNVGSKSAIMDYLDRNTVETKTKADPAAKAPKAVKAPKAKAVVAADEDAPF